MVGGCEVEEVILLQHTTGTSSRPNFYARQNDLSRYSIKIKTNLNLSFGILFFFSLSCAHS